MERVLEPRSGERLMRLWSSTERLVVRGRIDAAASGKQVGGPEVREGEPLPLLRALAVFSACAESGAALRRGNGEDTFGRS